MCLVISEPGGSGTSPAILRPLLPSPADSRPAWAFPPLARVTTANCTWSITAAGFTGSRHPRFPSFLKTRDRRFAGDADVSVHHRTLCDCDGLGRDAAMDSRGLANLELAGNEEASGNRARHHGLCGADVAFPAGGG